MSETSIESSSGALSQSSPAPARGSERRPAIAPVPRPAWCHAQTLEARSRSAVRATLAFVIAGLLLSLMAMPASRRTRADLDAQRLTSDLHFTLAEMRATVAEYFASHGQFPGAGPSQSSDPFWLEHQLDLAFRRAAADSATFGSALSRPGDLRTRAFQIDGPVLENPLNHLSNVRFLNASEPWPLQGDDTSGWLYRPATGEIRANSPGTSPWSGTRFLDM
jgi:hypothetical protein